VDLLMMNGSIRRVARLAALPVIAALAACSGGETPVTPHGTPERIEVVLNSVDNSLTVFSTDSASPVTKTVGLGAQGTPVGVAVRGSVAVVPLGTYPFAAIVDLRSGTVTRTVALPANSGATGAGFLNDSIVIVANPNRNSVSPVNVRTGAVGPEVTVGTYPQAVVEGSGVVFVINANLVNFSPAGPGSISAMTTTNKVDATVALGGTNPSAGVVSGTRLFVVNSGHFGQNDGSLSMVNLASGQVETFTGFGEFPGSADVGPDGNVYVGVYGKGILVWNPGLRQFVRGLDNPIVPGGAPPVAALGFDQAGRLHTLNPGDCLAAGKEYRLSGTSTVTRTVTTGVCPFAIDFTELTPVD
jgi:hypothetical protein